MKPAKRPLLSHPRACANPAPKPPARCSDDNFATMEAAVRQGRRTYDNLRKLIMFLLPTSIAQGLSIAIGVYIGVPPPLNSVQIL